MSINQAIANKLTLDIGPIILRVANWPIEIIDKLNSPHLAEKVDKWIEKEEALHHNSVDLCNRISDLIYTIGDSRHRSKLISLRRRIHHSTNTIPNSLVQYIITSEVIPYGFKEVIHQHYEERIAHAAEKNNLAEIYKLSLAAECNEIQNIVADDFFQKALYIASPGSFQALVNRKNDDREAGIGTLDFTLYSYIMRSVGRGTPNGAWAGVSLESESYTEEGQELIHSDWDPPGKALFEPDLNPFMETLDAMAHNNPWRDKIPLKLNPVLFKKSDSLWQFGKYERGIWHTLYLVDEEFIPAIISLFDKEEALTPEQICNHLISRKIIKSVTDAKGIISEMVDAGILWTTLQPPTRYDDAWDALNKITDKLPDEEKHYWEECLQELEKICNFLNLNYWKISIITLCQCMDTARNYVNILLSRYGLPLVSNEKHVIIVDMLAPFNFTVSSKFKSIIEKAVRTYWNFDRYGLGEAQAKILRHRIFHYVKQKVDLPIVEFMQQIEENLCYQYLRMLSCGHGQVVGDTDTSIKSNSIANTEIPAQIVDEELIVKDLIENASKRWQSELDPVYNEHYHLLHFEKSDNTRHAPLCPGSALMLLDISDQDYTLRIGGITPDPCIFYSRLNKLLQNDNGDDTFIRWYRCSIKKIEAFLPHLRFADLSVISGRNPNAACRPKTTELIIDGLNWKENLISLARIQIDESGRPRFYLPTESTVVIPYLHSAISTCESDPYSQCLSSISYLLGHPSLMRPIPLFSSEIDRWLHLPRLYLSNAIVINPERWSISHSLREELEKSSGLDRYIAWRKFVRSTRLPQFVYGRYGVQQTEMLMNVDSIMAVEHLGRALRKQNKNVTLWEAFPSPHNSWLCDDKGRHYLVEIAVAWQGDFLFWRDYLKDP
jgi:hypothetical protein